MDERARAATAREFRVAPASIDQMQALGIDDAATLQLLYLRDGASLELPIGTNVQDIKPPVREITNTYFLFGANEEGLERVQAVSERHQEDLRQRFSTGTPLPASYREAQQLVTESYQRSLFVEIIANHVLSRIVAEVEPSAVDASLIHGMIGGASLATNAALDITLDRQVNAIDDRLEVETAVQAAIDAALKLPDDAVFLRTPTNRLVVLSKPDILLRFARYKPGDEQFLAAVRAAITQNIHPYRAASRKLDLYRLSGNADDLFDAGMTAFTAAGELVARPLTLTERRSSDTARNTTRLFTVLHDVIVARGDTVDAQSPEIRMMRALIDRATLVGLYQRSPWHASACRNLAALTTDEADIQRYRDADPSGYLDSYARNDASRLESVVQERLQALAEVTGGERIQPELAVQAAVNLIELISMFNNQEARQAVFGLDLLQFEKGKASRIRNALTEALLAHNDLDTATQVVNEMTNAKQMKLYLTRIAAARTFDSSSSSLEAT